MNQYAVFDSSLRSMLRASGLIGVFAASMMFLSDCVIMDSSASGQEFGYVALDRLTNSPNWRLSLGGISGPVAACFFVVGFAHVYLALQPGGKRAAFTCAAGFASGYVILGAWHAAGPLFAFVNRMQPNADNPTSHESWGYLASHGLTGVIPVACSILLLPVLTLFRQSLYPRWFALVNPGVIYVLCAALFKYAPSPVGGYLMMGSGSLSFLAFFVASTAMLWNGGVRDSFDS